MSAANPNPNDGGEVAPAVKEYKSLAELAGTNLIAFQGGVYDLEDFAVGHPGGSELVQCLRLSAQQRPRAS